MVHLVLSWTIDRSGRLISGLFHGMSSFSQRIKSLYCAKTIIEDFVDTYAWSALCTIENNNKYDDVMKPEGCFKLHPTNLANE